MARIDPDISQLQKAGDVRALLRLLNHSLLKISLGAAEALANMDLKPGENKKAQKMITKAVKKLTSKEGFIPIVPIAIGVYMQSRIHLERLSSTETLRRTYSVWSDAYIELLKQHKKIYGNVFKLGNDSERIRHGQIEQIAKRVLTLAASSINILNDGDFKLRFIIKTLGNLEQLVSLDGYNFLSRQGHAEGDHDWTLSRSVYQTLCKHMEKYTGLKFGFDQNRWSRLRNNIMALWSILEIDLKNPSSLDANHLSLIEKRTDLNWFDSSLWPY